MILSLGGCSLRATVPFFALTAFLLLADQTGMALCGLCAAALHECGHLLAMILCGRPPSSIRLTAFGAEISTHSTAGSYGVDACIAVAGPVLNLILWGATAALMHTAISCRLLCLFSASNAALAVFNLLPIEPLDGGQALLSLLSLYFPRDKSLKVVMLISFLILVPLGALSFLLLFHSCWNVTLLLAVIYLVFLLVMKNGRYV
ncbi:MAG: hypothetical protein LKF71_07825 [Oscillospiraceae bacterium]|jgi:stage IV sporulation protein FB|nr:hypothetical protein [Oscillospiraceae bacterium]